MKKTIFKRRGSVLSLRNLIILSILILSYACSEERGLENGTSTINSGARGVTPQPGVIYTIENRNSGRIMEIENGSNSNGANLQQSGGSDATPRETHRMWEIFNTSDGFIRIRSVDSRKSLEVRDGSNANGANVEQRSFGGETHQEWEILPTSNGYFRIRSRDSRKSITVEGASRSTGANIEIDAWNGDDRFQWKFNVFGESEEIEVPSNEEIIEEVVEEIIEEIVDETEEEEVVVEEIVIEEIVEEVMEEEVVVEII